MARGAFRWPCQDLFDQASIKQHGACHVVSHAISVISTIHDASVSSVLVNLKSACCSNPGSMYKARLLWLTDQLQHCMTRSRNSGGECEQFQVIHHSAMDYVNSN